ncbi:MAG: hypothetical protein IT584_02845 [Chlamydiae bacterium]|nr:hypothetical protein [Chlamydiota bacterium]
MSTPPVVSSAQTFINQIHQAAFTPLSEFEEDPFWDSLTPASNSEPTENEQVRNNIPQSLLKPSEPNAGQGIFDDFDGKEFMSHIKV